MSEIDIPYVGGPLGALLDAPAREPPRCKDCHRKVPCGPLVAGLGEKCARKAGLHPPRAVRAPRLPAGVQPGPDLLSLIGKGDLTMNQATDRAAAAERIAAVVREFPFGNYGLADVDPTSEYAEWVPALAADIAALDLAAGQPHSGDRAIAVYVSIGNSDDKLTQLEWAHYYAAVDQYVAEYAHRVHGRWLSVPSDPWQNACWCVEVPEYSVAMLRNRLVAAATAWRQDSIAWAQATPEFLGTATEPAPVSPLAAVPAAPVPEGTPNPPGGI